MEVKILVLQLALFLPVFSVFGKPSSDDDCSCTCLGVGKCGCLCVGGCGCGNLTFEIGKFMDTLVPSAKPKKDVIFYLYQHPSESIELNQDNIEQLDSSAETKIIIHGWFGDASASWALKMKDEYLRTGNYNVIIIDYGYYAKTEYSKATRNIGKVGKKIAELLVAAHKHSGLDFNKVHLIGHSLGAHVCEKVAKHLENHSILYKLNRISGLDPAGPLFHKANLEKSAKFVDIYHTGAILFGTIHEIGTTDYYINGGFVQPDCKTKYAFENKSKYGLNIFYEILNFANNKCAVKVRDISCNHGSSTWYWVDSITSNKKYDSDRGKVTIGEHADLTLTGKVCVRNVKLHIPKPENN